MVADVDIVREREQRIRQYVKDLESFGDLRLEEFRRNRERQYAVLHALQLASAKMLRQQSTWGWGDRRHHLRFQHGRDTFLGRIEFEFGGTGSVSTMPRNDCEA